MIILRILLVFSMMQLVHAVLHKCQNDCDKAVFKLELKNEKMVEELYESEIILNIVYPFLEEYDRTEMDACQILRSKGISENFNNLMMLNAVHEMLRFFGSLFFKDFKTDWNEHSQCEWDLHRFRLLMELYKTLSHLDPEHDAEKREQKEYLCREYLPIILGHVEKWFEAKRGSKVNYEEFVNKHIVGKVKVHLTERGKELEKVDLAVEKEPNEKKNKGKEKAVESDSENIANMEVNHEGIATAALLMGLKHGFEGEHPTNVGHSTGHEQQHVEAGQEDNLQKKRKKNFDVEYFESPTGKRIKSMDINKMYGIEKPETGEASGMETRQKTRNDNWADLGNYIEKLKIHPNDALEFWKEFAVFFEAIYPPLHDKRGICDTLKMKFDEYEIGHEKINISEKFREIKGAQTKCPLFNEFIEKITKFLKSQKPHTLRNTESCDFSIIFLRSTLQFFKAIDAKNIAIKDIHYRYEGKIGEVINTIVEHFAPVKKQRKGKKQQKKAAASKQSSEEVQEFYAKFEENIQMLAIELLREGVMSPIAGILDSPEDKMVVNTSDDDEVQPPPSFEYVESPPKETENEIESPAVPPGF